MRSSKTAQAASAFRRICFFGSAALSAEQLVSAYGEVLLDCSFARLQACQFACRLRRTTRKRGPACSHVQGALHMTSIGITHCMWWSSFLCQVDACSTSHSLTFHGDCHVCGDPLFEVVNLLWRIKNFSRTAKASKENRCSPFSSHLFVCLFVCLFV